MPKIQKVETNPGEPETWLFRCPGCDVVHYFEIPPWRFVDAKGKTTDARDLDRPTVKNSIAVHAIPYCHSFITDGRIAFEADSKHALAGQTVDLPEFSW